MYSFEEGQFFSDPDTSKDEARDSGIDSGSDEEEEEPVLNDDISMGSGGGVEPANLFGTKKKKPKKKKQTNYHR